MIVDRFGIHVFMCFLSFLDGEDVNEVIISTWEKGSSRRLYRMGMKCDILSLEEVAEINGLLWAALTTSTVPTTLTDFMALTNLMNLKTSTNLETLIDLTVVIDIGIAINNLRHLMCHYRRQSSGVVCGLEVAINFCSP